MNAAPAVSQIPIASDPAQIGSAASANSVNSGGKGADFAAALSKAGNKPTRKPAAGAAVSGAAGTLPDGGILPGAGSPSPPPAVSLGTSVAVPEGAGTDQSAAGASTAAPGSAQGVQVARVAPEPAGFAPGIAFSLDLLAGAGEQGAQGMDKAALVEAGSAGAAPAPAVAAAATQASGIAPTDASVQQLSAAKAEAVGRATVSGGLPVGIRAGLATSVSATSAPAAAAPTGDASSAAAQANAAASDPSSLGATAAVMVAATGAIADNSTTADSTLSPATDLAAPAGGSAGAAGAAVANGVPATAIPSTAASSTESAGANAADKHARSDGGGSSAGAAQLSANSAGALAPGASTLGAADPASAPTLKVAVGVDSPEFGQGLADRLSWMVDNNVSSAKLQINPPQLGPIEVRIALQGDHAQVWLVSHSAVTRDALQSSSPNLREMLGAQGFGQVSVDISQRDFQDRSAHAQPYERTSASMTGSSTAISAVAASLPRLSSGAVDAYA